MITKIGVIYQDGNSLGFLRGLRDRLKCEAELLGPPTAIGKSRVLPRRQARLAWLYFQKKGVDLIIRFTDSDRHRRQDVRRKELASLPDEAQSMWVCGVAVHNTEDWICLDVRHLANVLQVPVEELQDSEDRTGRIKRALKRVKEVDETPSDVVARIVRDAPSQVFRRWLEDDAFRDFYVECRAAATRAECDTPNELEAPVDG